MSRIPSAHVVLVPTSLRSHLRLILSLASLLLQQSPTTVVTLLITSTVERLVQDELGRLPTTSAILSLQRDQRWRQEIIEEDLPVTASAGEEKKAFRLNVRQVLDKMLEVSAVWGRPRLFISDMLRASLRRQVGEACQDAGIAMIPVFHFWPTMALAMHRSINTTEDGGAYEGMKERMLQYTNDGMDENDAALKAYRFVRNRLLRWPDLPPMYDYEYTPQAILNDITPSNLDISKVIFSVTHNTDGIICNGVPEIDGDSIHQVQEVIGKPVYGVGVGIGSPLSNPCIGHPTPLSSPGIPGDPCIEFLNRALEKSGERSAVYISFGTLFWPSRFPELVDIIIQTLIARRTPFLFAMASRRAHIDETVQQAAIMSGYGMFSDFAPQGFVMAHPAIGCFITHCGLGSLVEAITNSVPILTIPFAMDQPPLSAHFTQIQQIGIQLDLLEKRRSDPKEDEAPSLVDITVLTQRLELALEALLDNGSNESMERHSRMHTIYQTMMTSEKPGGLALASIQDFIKNHVE